MRVWLLRVTGTATLSLALLAVGNVAASVFIGRIGSKWPVVFDEAGRPLDPNLTFFQHGVLTLTNGAEALAMGCMFFFLAPPSSLGLVAAVFPAALAGSGKLTVGLAALWLTLALALLEFGGFQIIEMMSV